MHSCLYIFSVSPLSALCGDTLTKVSQSIWNSNQHGEVCRDIEHMAGTSVFSQGNRATFVYSWTFSPRPAPNLSVPEERGFCCLVHSLDWHTQCWNNLKIFRSLKKIKQGKPAVLIFCPPDMAKRGSLFKKSSEHINTAGSVNLQWGLVYSLLMLSEMNTLEALNQQQQQTSAVFKQKQTTQLVNIHRAANFQHSWKCWGLNHFKINPASFPRKKNTVFIIKLIVCFVTILIVII